MIDLLKDTSYKQYIFLYIEWFQEQKDTDIHDLIKDMTSRYIWKNKKRDIRAFIDKQLHNRSLKQVLKENGKLALTTKYGIVTDTLDSVCAHNRLLYSPARFMQDRQADVGTFKQFNSLIKQPFPYNILNNGLYSDSFIEISKYLLSFSDYIGNELMLKSKTFPQYQSVQKPKYDSFDKFLQDFIPCLEKIIHYMMQVDLSDVEESLLFPFTQHINSAIAVLDFLESIPDIELNSTQINGLRESLVILKLKS